MVSLVSSAHSLKGKPHYRRTQEVYTILDASPSEETYDRLIEYVRQSTGKGCSRKLISKWKKTVISHQRCSELVEELPVTSKLIKNHQDDYSLITENYVTDNLRSQINNCKNDSSLITDASVSEKQEIDNCSQLTDYSKSNWSLKKSLLTATAIFVGIVGCSWFFSKDNSQPVIAQPASIQNSEFKVQNTSSDGKTESIQNPKLVLSAAEVSKIQNQRVQNGLPRTIKIDLTLTSPQDLKVKPGDEVAPGQVLSDRTTERQRLLAQKKQLEISLKKLDLPIPELTQPKPIPALSKLPPVSYQQEEANIALKQQELAEAERAIANHKEKIRQLRELLPETQPLKAIPANSQGKQNLSEMATNSIPLPKPEAEVHRENESSITTTQEKGAETPVALIIEHEQAILSQLKAARDKAKLQLDIAKSQLITAKEQRAQVKYQRYLEETKRAIALQQQQIELERQRSIRAGQLQEREYSKAQIETKIQEVDNAIAQLSTVKAPYPGKIKKVKWTGQSDHNLTVTITLDVDNGSEQSTVTSEQ